MSVSAFQLYKLHDIPESLRLLARQIECGDLGEVPRILVAIELQEGVTYRAFGEEPYTYAHAAGLCMAAVKEILE